MSRPDPRPTPAAMAGRKDPALSVRPVDYATAARDHARHLTRGASEPRGDRTEGRPRPSSTGEETSARSRAALARRITAALQANTNRTLSSQDSLHEVLSYSLSSGDPVPTGDRLQLSTPDDGVHVVGAREATLADLQRVIEEPEDSWTTDLGRTDYFLRGDLCVQLRRTDAEVVGIYRAGWALARRPDAPLPEEPLTGRSPSAGQGTRYPTTERELLRRLRDAGFVVARSGPTHGKITHPDHPGRFLPYSSTPSSHRHGRHVVTAVKRVFGIELRD